MRHQTILCALLSLVAAAALTACGGGDDDGVDQTAASIPAYPSVLAQLGTTAGLTDPAVARAYDDSYLDGGVNKAQVVDALARESTAKTADPAHSLFPQVALNDATLSNCDAQNVCVLTGTLRNADADDTSVAFSTRVLRIGNAYRLLGDQAAS